MPPFDFGHCFGDLTLRQNPYVAEYEADSVAVKLVGHGQVIYGIIEMARLCGEGLTAKRRNRLWKLGVPPAAQ